MDNQATIKTERRRMAYLVGLFLLAVYLLSYRGGFHSIDEVSMFAVTESMVKFGTLNTDQIAWTQWTTTQAEAQGFFGPEGHVYSKKGLALSLVQAPLYWLALHTPGLGMLQTVSLVNGLLTAATAAIMVLFVARLGYAPGTARLVGLVYGLATIAAVYAKYLFSEPLAALCLLLAAYMLFTYRQEGGVRHLFIGGFAAGFAVLTRANNLFLLPLFGVYLVGVVWARMRRNGGGSGGWASRPPSNPKGWDSLGDGVVPVLAFTLSVAVSGVLLLQYNLARSGDPFQTGYDLSLFTPNMVVGLYKLLFSPLRGLFIYSPILLLSVPGWWLFRRRHGAEGWLFAGLVSVTLALFAAWSSGEGLSWGSRFLVPVVPFFAMVLAPLISMSRRVTLLRWGGGLLLLISMAVQFLGSAINPWVYLNRLQAEFGGEFFLERTAALYDFRTSQIGGQWESWAVENSDVAWWQPWGFDGLALLGLLGLLGLAGGLLAVEAGQWGRGRDWRFRGLYRLSPLIFVVGGYLLLARYYQTDGQFGPQPHPYMTALRAAAAYTPDNQPLLTVAQYDYHVPMNRFKARQPLIGMAQQRWPLPPTAGPLLLEAIQGEEISLITVGFPPAAADNAVERWLAEHAYIGGAEWFGESRLLRYSLVEPRLRRPLDVVLGGLVVWEAVSTVPESRAGESVPVRLVWRPVARSQQNYTLFLQLLTVEGALVAQYDGLPGGGYLPTEAWFPGQRVVSRHALWLPVDLSAGDYRLIGGLYNPVSGARLPTATGAEWVALGLIRVE